MSKRLSRYDVHELGRWVGECMCSHLRRRVCAPIYGKRGAAEGALSGKQQAKGRGGTRTASATCGHACIGERR
jgi:hypothetical protein